MSGRFRRRGESSFEGLELFGFDGGPRTASLAGHCRRVAVYAGHRRAARRVFRRRVVVLLVLGRVLGLRAAVGVVVQTLVFDRTASGGGGADWRREADTAAGRQSAAAGAQAHRLRFDGDRPGERRLQLVRGKAGRGSGGQHGTSSGDDRTSRVDVIVVVVVVTWARVFVGEGRVVCDVQQRLVQIAFNVF